MSLIKRILAIVPSDMKQTPALLRAVELARRCGAELHLFMPVFEARIDATAELVDPQVQRLARDQYTQQHLQWLAEWTARLVERGLKASCEVVWAKAVHEAVIGRLREQPVDLVVKDLNRRRFLNRWPVIPGADWRLLRLCPAPLMLVQEQSSILPARIAAAVDPSHPHARPSELDDRVVQAALPLAMALDAALELAHVFPYRHSDAGLSNKMDELLERLRTKDAEAFTQFADRYGVAAEQRALLGGEPVEELLQYIEQAQIDLLVFGSQYRGGLERMLLGSNAEALITQAACDLLLVRPDGFTQELERHYG